MQRICSLLIFQSVDLPRPLTEISPWLELVAHPVDEIHAIYEKQDHQRFIKSHTPFDGLPYRQGSRYIFVGRDPRDIFVSLFNHLQNASPEASQQQLK
jgi:aryl sulfotransferase